MQKDESDSEESERRRRNRETEARAHLQQLLALVRAHLAFDFHGDALQQLQYLALQTNTFTNELTAHGVWARHTCSWGVR